MARLNRRHRQRRNQRIVIKKRKYTWLIFVNTALMCHLYADKYGLYGHIKQWIDKVF